MMMMNLSIVRSKYGASGYLLKGPRQTGSEAIKVVYQGGAMINPNNSSPKASSFC